jgi:hypothetical protein
MPATLPLQDVERTFSWHPVEVARPGALQQGGSLGSGAELHPLGCCVTRAADAGAPVAFALVVRPESWKAFGRRTCKDPCWSLQAGMERTPAS